MPDPNAAEQFHDKIVTHQINILRVAADQRATVLASLEKIEADLAVEIQQATLNGKSPLSIARMQALQKQDRKSVV